MEKQWKEKSYVLTHSLNALHFFKPNLKLNLKL